MMTDAMVSLSPATVSTAELSPLRAATRAKGQAALFVDLDDDLVAARVVRQGLV